MPAFVYSKADNQHYLVKAKSENLVCDYSSKEIALYDMVYVIRDYSPSRRRIRIFLPEYKDKIIFHRRPTDMSLCKVTDIMPEKPNPWSAMVHYDSEGGENV